MHECFSEGGMATRTCRKDRLGALKGFPNVSLERNSPPRAPLTK